MYFDLHRHDEFSSFDGFGKPKELAKQAKELGYNALGIANHGNMSSLIQHYQACQNEDIKPILGVEAYFLPKHKEKHRGYHLCLFAKNVEGYGNLNRIHTEGEKQKYYNAILDFDILEKHSKGVIATNACVASYISQALVKGNKKLAIKATQEFKRIFGEDFYFEIQPFEISDPGVQEQLNYELYQLAKEQNVKCILTSDSHFGRKEDFPTYLKMHQIGKHDFFDIEATYADRYMPSEKEIGIRFLKMHDVKRNGQANWSIPNPKAFLKEMLVNLQELQMKVEGNIFEQLESGLPKYDPNVDSRKLIYNLAKQGLKERGKFTKPYLDRVKEELKVIFTHGFEDYFLMVADYTNWAKDQGIIVGPGRGSGCNSIVNYALKITDVDAILFDLDFSRFLNIDDKKMPDIDLDFETDRRDEVIDYLLNKYPSNSAQICSYGLYQVDNLINDLAKLSELEHNPDEIKEIKRFINSRIIEGQLDLEALINTQEARVWNAIYDDVIIHFTKLYKKVRYIGTHAAGVAISGGNILDYTSIRYDSKTRREITSFDLNDLEEINVIKFDILGLRTLSSIGELRKLTNNETFNEEWIHDELVLEAFREGSTDGIFQFDKASVQDLLRLVDVKDFNDVVAASAMNRPGPLSLKIPEDYALNKANPDRIDSSRPYSKHLELTYGNVIYQEQVMAMAREIGGFNHVEARALTKMERGGTQSAIDKFEKNYKDYLERFSIGARKLGMSEEETINLFDTFFNYSFNKGHSTGYTLISVEEMYYKVYYPTEYWYVKMKYSQNATLRAKFKSNAVGQDVVIFLPHVNYSADDTLREVEGETVIQEGLMSIKGVGAKAAKFIEEERIKNGVYISQDDFLDRVKDRSVHKGVISLLNEYGALDFNKESYIIRLKRYNSSLYARAQRG